MNKSLSDLIGTLNSVSTIQYTKPVYRMHNPVWAWDPLSCEGAIKSGGRFNPKGSPALYLSLSAKTAILEVTGGAATGLIKPMTLCSYQLSINGIVDLRHHKNLFESPWRIMLMQNKVPPGWVLYEIASKIPDIKGFIVPSYQHIDGANLVLIHWEKDDIILHDPDGLLNKVLGENGHLNH